MLICCLDFDTFYIVCFINLAFSVKVPHLDFNCFCSFNKNHQSYSNKPKSLLLTPLNIKWAFPLRWKDKNAVNSHLPSYWLLLHICIHKSNICDNFVASLHTPNGCHWSCFGGRQLSIETNGITSPCKVNTWIVLVNRGREFMRRNLPKMREGNDLPKHHEHDLPNHWII